MRSIGYQIGHFFGTIVALFIKYRVAILVSPFICVSLVCIFLFIVPSTNPELAKAPTHLPQIEQTRAPTEDVGLIAIAVVKRFYDLRTHALNVLDGSAYSSVLSGIALEKRLNAIETLRSKNCYWAISNQFIQFDSCETINQDYVVVDITISEVADLSCNGIHDPGSYRDPYRMRSIVERINGAWLITDQTKLDQP